MEAGVIVALETTPSQDGQPAYRGLYLEPECAGDVLQLESLLLRMGAEGLSVTDALHPKGAAYTFTGTCYGYVGVPTRAS
jgi:hypothetical protein